METPVALLSAFDLSGGASRAALRLHRALRQAGAASTLVVHRQESEEPGVVGLDRRHGWLSFAARAALDRLPLRLAGLPLHPYRSPAWVGRPARSVLAGVEARLVHLHWINAGFLRPEGLADLGRPLVWTLHDRWPFCGAEHHPADDSRPLAGYPPEAALPAGRRFDLDRRVHRRKQRAYARLASLQLVAPSHWIGREARRSALLGGRPLEVIPNAVDTDRFRPQEQAAARAALGLPQQAALVLYAAGAIDAPWKGFHHLAEVLGRLAQGAAGAQPPRPVELVVLGAAAGPPLPVPAHWLGYRTGEAEVAQAIAAADVTVCPSEMDNLPYSAMESLACGVPVAAFEVGGLPDLVSHRSTGWLAPPGVRADLAAGIAWILGDHERRRSLATAARARAVERFSGPVVAAAHLALYARVLAGAR